MVPLRAGLGWPSVDGGFAPQMIDAAGLVHEILWHVYLEQGQHDLPSMLAKLARDRAAGLVTVDAKVLAEARITGPGAVSTSAGAPQATQMPLHLQLQLQQGAPTGVQI